MEFNKTKSPKLGIIYVLLALLILATAFQFVNNFKGKNRWECAQVVCSKLMTEREIAATICSSNAQGEMICQLNVDGQTVIKPLSQLNLTGLSICAEYNCVKEIQVRNAKYVVNVTQTAA